MHTYPATTIKLIVNYYTTSIMFQSNTHFSLHVTRASNNKGTSNTLTNETREVNEYVAQIVFMYFLTSKMTSGLISVRV